MKNLFLNGDLVINYKLNRRFSVGSFGSINKQKYRQKYVSYSLSGTEIDRLYQIDFIKSSLGVQLNYYFSGNISPLGNSLSIFYVSDIYKVQDYNEFHAYLQRKQSDDFQTNEKIQYTVQYVGAELNYVKVLSSNYPIYLKYGASFAFPYYSGIRDYTVNDLIFNKYSDINSSYNDYDFLNAFKKQRLITLNFGFGILIR